MNRLTKILGLAIGPKSLLLAEVSSAGKAGALPAIQKLAEFAYPEGMSPGQPAELGAVLGAFLRVQGFGVKDAIIGLPARRLLTRRKEVPPASETVAASTLRLQAEGEFASEADTFAFDYAGQTSPSAASAVMLVATTQSGIDECQALAKAAGLRLRGITATSAALGQATGALPGGDGLVVTLASGAAELVVQHGRSSTQLRHLAVPNAGTAESMSALAGEIRRTVATLHQNGTPLSLALWDDSATPGSSGSAGSLLEQRLGMPVRSPELGAIATVNGAGMDSGRPGAFAPAVAVALSGLDTAVPPIDFLNSRLKPPAERTNKRPIMIGSAIAGVFLLAIVGGFVDLYVKQSTLDELNQTHNVRGAEIKKAQTAADHLADARKWTTRKDYFIACLRDFTDLLPDSGGPWVTNFTLSGESATGENKYKGKIVGKASDEAQIKTLLAKLNQSKVFINATPDNQQMQKPGTVRGPVTTEQSFGISFTYKPLPPATAPSTGRPPAESAGGKPASNVKPVTTTQPAESKR